jgi:hypothetical protein
MAHESFENEEIAALMNDLFVSVKVDREERPDVDALYQSALAMLGEQGGWPLTMFLTPSGEPFWGGTYFPPTARWGRPGFADVLNQVAAVYRDQRDKVEKNVGALRDGLGKLAAPAPGQGFTPETLDEIATLALRLIDPIRGGTAGAPKFPQPVLFRFLWRAAMRTRSPLFADAVLLTLVALSQGGIYDHVGGGFSRYATDAAWLVPHFEKMLYDNALLVELMTEVWCATGRPLYQQRIAETVDWLISEMTVALPDGPCGFVSAMDADSEGEEGRYYVWTQAEIEALLGDEAAAFSAAYDVSPHGNWEGRTILRRRDAGEDPADRAALLARGRATLLAARRQRVPPSRDDKVLADWNGLVIAALARAGTVFDRTDWLAAATAAFDFICSQLAAGDRLHHSWCAGRAAHPGTLEDYANMARAALTLYEITAAETYLERAKGWVATADRWHWDATGDGYFVSAADTHDLPMRTKPIADHAVPSGNGVMVEVLAKLYYLTGNTAYRDRADRIVTLFSGDNAQYLLSVPGLLTAYELLAGRPVQVILLGEPADPAVAALRRTALTSPNPLVLVQTLATGETLPANHPAHGKVTRADRAMAYVCIGPVCGLPVHTPSALSERLAGS